MEPSTPKVSTQSGTFHVHVATPIPKIPNFAHNIYNEAPNTFSQTSTAYPALSSGTETEKKADSECAQPYQFLTKALFETDHADSDTMDLTIDSESDFSASSVDSDEDENNSFQEEAQVEEEQQTLRHLDFFLDHSKDKHFIPLTIEPLTGTENYKSWLIGIELLMRQHQVWQLAIGEIGPLDESHDRYLWWELMRDVAITCIFANVSPEIRKDPCFVCAVDNKDPELIMQMLWMHFSESKGGSYVHDDDGDVSS